MRTEDELRGAFRMKADDAPSAETVMAGVRQAEVKPPARRGARRTLRMLAPAAAAAAVIAAIAVPLALTGSHSHSSNSSSGGHAMSAGGAGAGAGSSAAAGAGADRRGAAPLAPEPKANPALPVCIPSDVSFSLAWKQSGTGLTGALTATKIGGRACTLPDKPVVRILRADGTDLDVPQVVTGELRYGANLDRPGARAAAVVGWDSWCGKPASGNVTVQWGTGQSGSKRYEATVHASGPVSPQCISGEPQNLSSGWFNTLSSSTSPGRMVGSPMH